MIERVHESVELVGLVSWADPTILVTVVVTVTLIAVVGFMLYLAFGIESKSEDAGPSYEEAMERLDGGSRAASGTGGGLGDDEPEEEPENTSPEASRE